ncbi:unnamed protein product [Rhizoctonia solani]|uniref:Uncharacterized protein n=1 Tax=Rhizoctonia solani TaxID=456999 RepID=A0A8H3AX12_9AGAM|nr:unnamed protein product [Rhizoctonia solani]
MYLGAPLNFSALARYALTRFPLPIRKVRQVAAVNHWLMYFNPSRINTNKGSPRSRAFLPSDEYGINAAESATRSATLPPGLFLVRPAPSEPRPQSKLVRS